MGRRGRPSLRKTDYSGLNFHKLTFIEKEKLLIDLLSKAPRGMTVKEISKKFILEKRKIRQHLQILIDKGIVFGPYQEVYFHTKFKKTKNGK